ncbi:MAG: hypothetical protein JO168_03320 [Solirubrobacterales bacterium]|nr:hypothetical protein [Solirubrobacterales bacterium]MBV9716364.1 hypothetical protein [Solirubrobacterales bacterium]
MTLWAGWELASAPPGRYTDPTQLDGLAWLPAQVPGTAAAALRAAGLWHADEERDFDREDWWFRVQFETEPPAEDEALWLVLEGIATVAEVFVNGRLVLESDSMFAAHALEVTDRLARVNELAIRCLALSPLLAGSRRPRARWRTQIVVERNLRFFRTMLLGRAPGFASGPAAVGPWKPVRLERRRGIRVEDLRLRSRLERGEGRLAVSARLRRPAGAPALRGAAVALNGPSGRHEAALALEERGERVLLAGALTVPEVSAWWPHTHGSPGLYEAELVLATDGGEQRHRGGRVGFRSLQWPSALERDGLQLSVNGTPVFARGAVWTPPDVALPCSSPERLRPVLAAVLRGGMNMLRVPGIGCYEGEAFHDLCDELGILVWQDFMFANFDYPAADPGFRAAVEREARQLLGAIGGRPSLAMLCGGSEVAQQAAMMGIDPTSAMAPLYEQLLPGVIAEAEVEAPYVPSTPWGGDLPFRPGAGIANYYGVGAYRRPLEDARRCGVRFAAECLAFANVPDDDALVEISALEGPAMNDPRWKLGVPRDPGAGWDFEDVRDHYLREFFGADTVTLRSVDPERYLALSRQVSGEVMSEVLGEWRRGASACGGALVLWLKDLRPGAGWGLLDHRGAPKVAYHHVRRACAPVAVWSTDEGLDGVAVHLANDGPRPQAATLRVAMYRDLEVRVEEIERDEVLAPHSGRSENVEALLGRFVDASWAYRFGPPAQDLIVVSLEQRGAETTRLLSQCFRLPAGRPPARETPEQLGLSVALSALEDRGARLTVSARRFLYGVRPLVPGYAPDDDAFSVEPGRAREVWLRRIESAAAPGPPPPPAGCVSALNLSGTLAVTAATA